MLQGGLGSIDFNSLDQVLSLFSFQTWWVYLVLGVPWTLANLILIFSGWTKFKIHSERRVKLFPIIILNIIVTLIWCLMAVLNGSFLTAGVLIALAAIQVSVFLYKLRMEARSELMNHGP